MSSEIQRPSLDQIKQALSELSHEERAEIAKDLFKTADQATRLDITTEGLDDFPRGRMPFEAFKKFAWRTVLPTYEAAFIRPTTEADEGIDILLKQRQSEGGNADWWDGQWHVPGTVMLASDEWPEDTQDFTIIRDRLIAKEAGDAIELAGQPEFLPTVLREGARGKEVTVRQLVPSRLKSDIELPQNARYFNVRNILANPPGGGFVDSHEAFISGIADKYMNYYKA